MPNITYNKSGGSITYDQDDFLGGLQNVSGGRLNRKISGLAYSDGVDPLRSVGYISPGATTTGAIGNEDVDSYIRNGVNNRDKGAMITGGPLLLHFDFINGVLNVDDFKIIDFSPETAHGSDIANYYVDDEPVAFYSWRNDSQWDVGMYDWSQGIQTATDDFMSTVPAGFADFAAIADTGEEFDHPLVVGDDDVLYIGDRNFVHAYDGRQGADGTVTVKVLTLPQGFIITSFAKTPDLKLAIAGTYHYNQNAPFTQESKSFLSRSQVWVWNYLDLDPDYAYDLNDNYVSEVFNWKNTLAAFTEGRASQTNSGIYKLQLLSNGRFQVIQSWEGLDPAVDELPIRGGVEISNDDIYWVGGRTVFSYARSPFGDRYALNRLLNLSGATPQSGMLKLFNNVDPPVFYASVNGHGTPFQTVGGLQVLQPLNFAASGEAWLGVAYPQFPVLSRGRLHRMVLKFKQPFTDGRSFTVRNVLDKGTPYNSFDPITDITNLTDLVIVNRPDGTPLGDFTAIQPVLLWGAGSGTNPARCPELESLTYEFSFINVDP